LFPFLLRFFVANRVRETESVSRDSNDGHDPDDANEQVVVGVRLAAHSVPLIGFIVSRYSTVLQFFKVRIGNVNEFNRKNYLF